MAEGFKKPKLIRKAEDFIYKHPIRINKDVLYVFCTDSKGSRLFSHAPVVYKNNFLWRNVGGRRSEVGVNSIIAELPQICKLKSNVKLVFWHGTCDLTLKNANHLLQLRNNNNQLAIQNIRTQYERLIEETSKYGNIQLIFLEIPPISVSNYNYLHGGKEDYTDIDVKVEQQVQLHNQMVKELNYLRHVASPKFTEDLRTSRKKKGSSTQYFYDFKVYTDGVHPRQTLAKKWLCKIIDKINTF